MIKCGKIGVRNNQSNCIQINNTILSQENLKRLTAKQLNQIESVVTMVLPEGGGKLSKNKRYFILSMATFFIPRRGLSKRYQSRLEA
jgi:hypothetical protein